MKSPVRALCTIMLLAEAASGQHRGDLPPALVWDELKGACPASLDWKDLRGKAVVISLGSQDVQMEEIAEWNSAAQAVQSDPVLFVRVAAGSEFLLDQVLQQTAPQVCILLDEDSANARNFKVPLPLTTVVVDPLGFVAGYTTDGSDEHTIRSVLKNQSDSGLSESPPQARHFDRDPGLDPGPSFGIHISPAFKGERRELASCGPDLYIARNQPLKLLFMDLWNTRSTRIAFPEKLDEGYYDVIARLPGTDSESSSQLVQEAIERYFGLLAGKEERTERVYALTALGNPSPQLQSAAGDDAEVSGGGEQSIFGTAQKMRDIARGLEGVLNAPVVDRTGLDGSYNYFASSKLSGTEAAFDLAYQLGLELTEAERPIEMLVVRKVQ